MKTEHILRVVDISWRQVHQYQITLVVIRPNMRIQDMLSIFPRDLTMSP
jgi:hypothetical protein